MPEISAAGARTLRKALACQMLQQSSMKLICATDFSEPAVEAGRVAARLARRFGDELVLVHAWTSPFALYREVIADPKEVQERLVAQASRSLEKAAAGLRDEGVTVETRLIESGDPAEAITALASELDGRLIVVGTHRGHRATRLFIGSAAERTMLLADRPVLVVHPESNGLREWAENRRPLRLVVGLDRSAASQAAVGWVRTLRSLGPCDVVFLHAYWPVEQYARLGVRGAIHLGASDEETERVLARELRPLFADLPGSGSVELRLRPVWGSPAEPILDEVRSAKADLLVLGTHQKRAMARLWAGATVQPTVRLAQLPVLCVPATDVPVPETRPRLRHVLVATDFSELGNRAVAHAYEMARGDGSVTMLHVRERALPSPPYAYADDHDALTGPALQELEARLRALIPTEGAVPTNVEVIDGGQAATVIVQEANRAGVDAICLGSHGRSGLGRALMGSVAETVTRRAQRPVLIVRPGT
jgi:nucleotide-binding universal stress UspA family protein